MKKDLKIIFFLGLLTILVYFKAFNVFFAQDDFILINQFSQNSPLTNIINTFGPPKITHWRPLHNLYFLICGTVFGKNFFGYHLVSAVILLTSAYFVYLVFLSFLRHKRFAFLGALVYCLSPVNAVSLFWISGNATLIGFMFFIIAFYLYLQKKEVFWVFYLFSIMSSEAFFSAVFVFPAFDLIFRKRPERRSVLLTLGALVYLAIKVLLLTPISTFSAYPIEISYKIIWTLKYYILRILGYGEASGDLIASLILVFVLIYLFYRLAQSFEENSRQIIFGLFVMIAGLFPFILLKDHASGNYMNLSLFGFSFLCALSFKKSGRWSLILTSLIAVIFSYNVNLTYNNSWTVNRSLLAKNYIDKIENDNLPENTKIIFLKSNPDASEVYYSLAGSEAFKLIFRDKNYNVCFELFEKCGALP